MGKAWYLDEKTSNRVELIDLKDLYTLAGVQYKQIDINNPSSMKELKDIRKARGYNYDDILDISREKLSNYDDMLSKFNTEHLHEDAEMRLFLEGGGYFDFRDKNDKWIRFNAEKDDLLILPPGIYHKFSLDNKGYAKLLRMFSEVPCWTSFDRPADEHPARTKYLEAIAALG